MSKKTEDLKKYLNQKKGIKFAAQKLGISEEECKSLKNEILKEQSNNINFVHSCPCKGECKCFKDITFTTTTNVNVEKGTIESSVELTYEPQSVEELAKLHKIDLSKYKISNYWSKVRPNGKFTSSVLASLKKPQDYTAEDFAKFLENWEPFSIRKVNLSSGIIFTNLNEKKEEVDVELNIADFHLAKKTFQEDNLASKELDYFFAVNDLVSKIKANYNIGKLVFPISNDFFHSDNYQNTTTNGTPQDVTAWYDEEYEKGFDILANTINYLVTQAKEVEVILVQGNHDRTKGFFVAHALEVFFKGYKNVKFQRHHSVTKSTVLGNTFIGYHHGNSCKLEDLPLLFATGEYSKDFGNAKYREVHTGDKHHYLAKEVKGVRIQQVPSLSGTDRWHQDNGYINQIRAAIAFVYDPEKGKIAEYEFRL